MPSLGANYVYVCLGLFSFLFDPLEIQFFFSSNYKLRCLLLRFNYGLYCEIIEH
jgi:hypothetical protein